MPVPGAMIAAIDRRYPGLDADRRGAEFVRELISYFINAVVTEAGRLLAEVRPASVEDVRNAGRQLIAFPAEVADTEAAIKAFLKVHMYRHERVMRVMRDAEQIVFDLFARYEQDADDLPAEWQEGTRELTGGARARRIGNFIAGMTDRFALMEHHRLFDSTPDLR
jgi:dGTPase